MQTDGVWDPTPDDGATAGCNNATVSGCTVTPSPWNGTNLTATVGGEVVGVTDLRSPAVVRPCLCAGVSRSPFSAAALLRQALDFWRWDDPTFGEKWGNSSAQEINLSSPALRTLTAALGPGIIRIGGSPDDSIVFDTDGTCVPQSGGNGPAPHYYCSQVGPGAGTARRGRVGCRAG